MAASSATALGASGEGPGVQMEEIQYGVDRNLLVSLLGGQRRLPPTVHATEAETRHDTLAHELEHTARHYKAAFASRQPRLAKLAAYRSGNTHQGHFPGNDFELAMQDILPHGWAHGRRVDSIVIHDPARRSSSFCSQPRIVQPPVSKAALRATVLQGLPAYQGNGGRIPHRSPRGLYAPSKSPRLRPIGT